MNRRLLLVVAGWVLTALVATGAGIAVIGLVGRTFAGDGLLQCDVGVVQGITATGAHYVDRVVQSRLPHACSLPPPRRRASV